MKTYTFRISIPDLPDTWRTVELAGHQTLRDLHVAIQEALDWDPDDDAAFVVGENPLEGGEIYALDFDDDLDADDAEGDWDADDEDDDEIEAMIEGLPPLDLGDTPRPETMDAALALIESNPEVRAQVRQMLVDQMGVPGFMADMMLGSLRSLMEMMPEGALAGMMGAEPDPKNAAQTSLDSLGLATDQSMLYVYGEDDWRFLVRLEGANEQAEDDALYPLILDGDGPAPQQYFDDEDDWLWDDDEEDGDFEDED
jgi:hypothetical protein